jgi:hypothetical protein
MEQGLASLQPYNPTFRERSTKYVANLLRDKLGMENYDSFDLANRIFGREDAIGLSDATLLGALFGGQEGVRQFKRSDDLTGKAMGLGVAGLSALEALPLTAAATKPLVNLLKNSKKASTGTDTSRRGVIKGLAALPIAGAAITKGLPTGVVSKAAKVVPTKITGSSLLDNLPFVKQQLEDIFPLTRSAIAQKTKVKPEAEFQGLYYLEDMKEELEALAGMPKPRYEEATDSIVRPSAKAKKELLDKSLDDFIMEVDTAKRELVEQVRIEGDAGGGSASPITLELIEDFTDMNPGMTLREAIKKVDDEINTIKSSKGLSDANLETGFLIDLEMQRLLGTKQPNYMGAPMKDPDPEKTFRVSPDNLIERQDYMYEYRRALAEDD